MDAQFKFFCNPKIAADAMPIMAGLNYFLTHEARGGEGKKLLGEKKDVKVWLAWLERMAHGEVSAIDTPIGYLPRYADLKTLFRSRIDKDYPEDLYRKQFSLYIDNIIGRIDLQHRSYGKEEGIPPRLFDILDAQKSALLDLKTRFGSIVSPEQLITASDG
jgi:phosphoenolpyruvate carboxykinase (GTP)